MNNLEEALQSSPGLMVMALLVLPPAAFDRNRGIRELDLATCSSHGTRFKCRLLVGKRSCLLFSVSEHSLESALLRVKLGICQWQLRDHLEAVSFHFCSVRVRAYLTDGLVFVRRFDMTRTSIKVHAPNGHGDSASRNATLCLLTCSGTDGSGYQRWTRKSEHEVEVSFTSPT